MHGFFLFTDYRWLLIIECFAFNICKNYFLAGIYLSVYLWRKINH